MLYYLKPTARGLENNLITPLVHSYVIYYLLPLFREKKVFFSPYFGFAHRSDDFSFRFVLCSFIVAFESSKTQNTIKAINVSSCCYSDGVKMV